MRKRFILAAVLLIVMTLGFSVADVSADSYPSTIRVKLLFGQTSQPTITKVYVEGDGTTQVMLNGNGLLDVIDPHGVPSYNVPGPVIINSSSGILKVSKDVLGAPVPYHSYRGSIYVSPNGGTLDVINYVGFDPDYLNGLGEMPSSWPYDALYAQAIAARSYAIYQIQHNSRPNYDVDDSVNYQVYYGLDKVNGLMGDRWAKAVADTRGLVMVYNGQVIPGYFFSSCGGKTEHSENVWSTYQPYLRSVDDINPANGKAFCDDPGNGRFSWSATIDKAALEARLNNKYGLGPVASIGITSISIRSTGASPRVRELSVLKGDGSTSIIKGSELRAELDDIDEVGNKNMNSTWIDQIINADASNGFKFTVNGHGYGHGIGMCQFGAKGRAEAGQNYQQILSAYYPGVQITGAIPDYYLITISTTKKNTSSVSKTLSKKTGIRFDRTRDSRLQARVSSDAQVWKVVSACKSARTKYYVTKVTAIGSQDMTRSFQSVPKVKAKSKSTKKASKSKKKSSSKKKRASKKKRR